MDRLSDEPSERSTAPQSGFGWREVRIGLLVFLIGLVIVFAIPWLVL